MNSMISFIESLFHLEPVAYWIIGIIVAVFVISLIINGIIRRKYKRFKKDLLGIKSSSDGEFKSDFLNIVLEKYKSAFLTNRGEVNTQAIIEAEIAVQMKHSLMGERFIKNAVSLMVILGLFGTFLGLTMSVNELAKMLLVTEGTEWIEILNSVGGGLLFSLQGMAVAFVTSLFGIGCSILMTLYTIGFSIQDTRESLMLELEEYLDNHIGGQALAEGETEYNMMVKALQSSLQEFGERIQGGMESTIEALMRNLSEVAAGMGYTTGSLDHAIDKFDNALTNFGENVRDFSEFNFNLRNNIERMDVNFIKMSEVFIDRKQREISLVKMEEELGEIKKLLKEQKND